MYLRILYESLRAVLWFLDLGPSSDSGNAAHTGYECAGLLAMEANVIALRVNPEPWEGPTSRSPNSGFSYSYSVDDGAQRWIYFLDPPRGRGL